MAHRHEVQKHGKRVAYTGAGSNVVKEAESTSDGFKKGGKVHGKKGKHRLKRARGGRSGSPFSSAHTGHGAQGPASHHEPHHSSGHKRGGRAAHHP